MKKQILKLESVIATLQEGNKVTQQQIDLLNREARETAAHYEQQIHDIEARASTLQSEQALDNREFLNLQQEVTKLRRDAKWLRTVRDRLRNGLIIPQTDRPHDVVDAPFPAVLDAARATLGVNEYTILAVMHTDEKAVLITRRKTSHPTSLELTGFRNQYLLVLEKQPDDHTQVWVEADFEKVSQSGQILEASTNELHEIEHRLIQELQDRMATPPPTDSPDTATSQS